MKEDSNKEVNLFERIGPASALDVNSSSAKSISFSQDVWQRFKESKVGVTCIIILIILVLGAVLVPVFSPYSISEQDLLSTNVGFFQKGHLFGTDNLGRDIFTRVWYGTRISLTIALAAVLVGLFVGAIYGGVAGYFGGNVDNVMMRIVDIVIAIPYMIIVILLMVVLKPGISTIIIAYAAVGWTDMARLVRGQVIKLKESEYVLASRILGASPWYVIIKDLLPNTLSVIIVNLTLTIPGAIFTEAFLSYIGLGVQIPLASLGTLASEGVKSMQLYPHLLIVPAVILCITMLMFNLLGDVLRDILDPKLRR